MIPLTDFKDTWIEIDPDIILDNIELNYLGEEYFYPSTFSNTLRHEGLNQWNTISDTKLHNIMQYLFEFIKV